MEEEHALIEVKKLDVAVVFSEEGMTKILEKIKAKAKELTPDLSTDAGRKDIASMAYKVARSKTLLDDLGKGVIADWKEKVDNINKHRKAARDFLDSLKEEVRQPLTDWEAEQEKIQAEKIRLEQARVAVIRAKIQAIREKGEPYFFHKKSSADLMDAIVALSNTDVDESIFMEFKPEMDKVLYDATNTLQGAFDDMVLFEQQEADRKAESERLEKGRMALEAEAKRLEGIRLSAEEDARIAREFLEAERRKFAAEKAALEAEKAAEAQKKRQAEFEKQALENARITAERNAAEKVEAEKKAQEAAAHAELDRLEALAAEKARKEALKPDKNKILSWARELNQRLLDLRPDLSSPEARRIMDTAEGEIDISVSIAVENAKEL